MRHYQIIAVFNYAHEMIVLITILQSKEIPFLFQNENLIAVDPFSYIAYGGIHLKVDSKDLKEYKR